MEWLKYIVWVITFGTTFAGAWIFEFTSPNQSTGRKEITKPGYVAMLLVLIGGALGLYLTYQGDLDKQRATNNSERYQKQSDYFQKESVKFQEEAQKAFAKANKDREVIFDLLTVLNNNKDSLNMNDRLRVAKVVNESSELEAVYPDLAKSLDEATSVDDIVDIAKEIAERNVEVRFNTDRAGCSAQFDRDEAGYFTNLTSGSLLLLVRASPYESYFKFIDLDHYSKSPEEVTNWKGVVTFNFKDLSIDSRCTTRTSSDCKITLSDGSSKTMRLFSQLRDNSLLSIEAPRVNGGKSKYSFSDKASDELRSRFKCIFI
ncbi:hypothetical protein [Photobacterium alginatilyticum]|uniref:Uncharacterized protein n=1 Tax=Photobacterium alginatilyticum TaxID=1775171 RepID=A0ABW9YRX4_9GAMM|nr:hypothetical protein [Photobacterium alginatilyticum]NBI55549.1 hypothetical protein [Photobacterium alginatilyticum]